MINIKFIRKITDHVHRERKIIGNCVYYTLENGNRIKAYCESTGVKLEVINKMEGKVDTISLPFSNYFAPTQCSPKDSDYDSLAQEIEEYICMYE